MLIEEKAITESQLAEVLTEQKKAGVKLGQLLIQRGVVSEELIVSVLSKQLKIDKYDPRAYPPDLSLKAIIPMNVAQQNKMVPLRKNGNLLTVAMVDPMDINALDEVESVTHLEVEPVVCAERDFNNLVSTYFGMQSGIVEALGRMGNVELQVETDEREGRRDEEIKLVSARDMAEEAPVVSFVNTILIQAVREGASDIHFSPEKNNVQLRFRIDGKLHDVPAPPKAMALPIISRFKILANMDISITRIPQDGRFSARIENREINVRVSSVPTIHGENIVLRLLDMTTGLYTLDHLGMWDEDREKIENTIRKPYGMILSTGPTGSGKSTSLYAILQEINKPDIHIITLEDPIEYRVEGVRQVQLNRKAGMTFAGGLRSILRQDPDVIMVGEIRDAETAGIAVQSALTGHRVLSTMHTNDAAGAITRLLDMEIESFLVASVMIVSFAQRLVRTVCPYCKEEYTPSDEVLREWGIEKKQGMTFVRGKGCNQCINTGYRGRTGVFEVLTIDEDIQEMIVKKESARTITEEAKRQGKLSTLKDDAVRKVEHGITTLEEAASKVMI